MNTYHVLHGEGRFKLIGRYDAEEIFDTEDNTTLFFVATTGFGSRSKDYNTAKRVVDFLNSEQVNPTS